MNRFMSKKTLQKIMSNVKPELHQKEQIMETNNDTEIVKDLWYEGEKFEVIFRDENGNIVSKQEVTYKDAPNLPDPPVKPSTEEWDYEFKEWDKNTDQITGETTFHPIYEPISRYRTINFYNGDGSLLNTQQVLLGNNATLPSTNPTKTATADKVFTFSHWDKNSTNISFNLDIYPVFTDSIRYYTVNFYNHDNTILSTSQVPYNGTANKPSDPIKPKDTYFYTFQGWNQNVTNITSNLDVYPVFNRDEYLIAPEGKLDKWEYEILNDNVILNNYTGNEKDVIVYDRYTKDGIYYKTKIKSMNHILLSNKNINTIKFGNYVDFSELSNCALAFSGCTNLTSIDFGKGFDTSNVTDMSGMFYGYSSTSLDLTSFDTHNVTNMNTMFAFCTSLRSLDLTSFDTSNITNMNIMFGNCTNLKEIKVSRSKWVIKGNCETEYMFLDCGVDHVSYVD